MLINGIDGNYPTINRDLDPEERFFIFRKSNNPKTNYFIEDSDLQICVTIPRCALSDPTFDLIGFYRDTLEHNDVFNREYLKESIKTYKNSFYDLYSECTIEASDDCPELQSVSDLDLIDKETPVPLTERPPASSFSLGSLYHWLETCEEPDVDTDDDMPGLEVPLDSDSDSEIEFELGNTEPDEPMDKDKENICIEPTFDEGILSGYMGNIVSEHVI